MIEFREFQKIGRWSREVVVTEKIDGTNASVFIGEDGEFLTGSRTRWITPQDDNHGFSRWAHERRGELMRLGPGMHYGEWWGNGIQRKYNVPDKRWSLFNVSRWCLYGSAPAVFPTQDPRVVKTQDVLPECVGLVPTLWRGNMDNLDIAMLMDNLRTSGSVAAPGFMKPEGIVIFHTANGALFKKTFEKDTEGKRV